MAKFVIALFVMTVVCTFAWQEFVYGTLYYCSDPVFDFLNPGDWVHVIAGQPAQVVEHVVVSNHLVQVKGHVAGSSSWVALDTIKEGWTVTRLWYLWYAFVGVSLFISTVVSQLRWRRKSKRFLTSLEPTAP